MEIVSTMVSVKRYLNIASGSVDLWSGRLTFASMVVYIRVDGMEVAEVVRRAVS